MIAGAPVSAVFVGASAGGVETLAELLSLLPADFPVPVLVVLHITPRGKDLLASILDRAGPLRAVTATHGQVLEAGTVHVGPRGRHMLVQHGTIALSDGPAEHAVRPAIDPLFRSGARCYGRGAIGVVLSGTLDDGTAGLGEIRAAGGWALAQDPAASLYPQMPTSAIAHVDVDWVLAVDALAAKLTGLAGAGLPARERAAPAAGEMRTDLTCPRCGAALWETEDGGRMTYRCRTGHEYSVTALLTLQGEGLEDAIWQPVRLLHQRGALQLRLAQHAEEQGREESARYFKEQSRLTLLQAGELRRLVQVDTAADAPHHDDAGPVS